MKDALHQEIERAGLGHRIEWKVPDAAWVNGDDELFRILASILIENAIRYSPPGSAVVVAITNEGSQFLLQLQNEAQEDPRDDPERLFQPFQRGAPRTSVNTPGAGLGLSLAREAAQALGGTVGMTFSPPGSVTCRVTLPWLREAQ